MRPLGRQEGAALVLVLLGVLAFVALGTFIILGVDRNTDLRFAYQRDVVGFNSAEAGIHVGAVGVQNAMLNFGLPTNCSTTGTSFAINGRTVTYYLSVPTGAPWNGVAGSCTETPASITEAQGTPFGGLSASLYTYNLTSSATDLFGYTEATVNSQFQSHLIPMFQFAAFYAGDLELDPSQNMFVNGRLHTNGNLYLDDAQCGSPPTNGLGVQGQITIVGSGAPGTAPLNRGKKSDSQSNYGNVYISLDGTTTNMQVLGTDAPGSMNCATTTTRQIGTAEINTFNTLGPRIITNLQNISLPSQTSLMCVPWLTGCPATGGAYWQNANLRIALNTTTTSALDGSACPGSKTAPCLYPVQVLNADGTVNGGLTTSLATFMKTSPGAITYSDVPKTANANWNCFTGDASCETDAYNNSGDYTTAFPKKNKLGCTVTRTPRTAITAANACNDYRYGGFFNWRELKPILMLNIDWMALEEYNDRNGNVFFNPSTTTNNGLVIFLTVKDTTGTEGLAADNYGVRIYDAGRARRNLTDPGVTFATDQAMYLTGNFNCPQPNYNGPTTSPAPCGDSTWPPTSSSTYQKSTSIAADSINMLSCGWIQAQACGSFNMNADQWAGVGTYRPLDEQSTAAGASNAVQTIINAAVYAGNDQTWCPGNPGGVNCDDPYLPTQAYGSAGMENYFRFHEDLSTAGWTQPTANFWYQGSLVASGVPNHTCFTFNSQLVAIADDPLYTCTLTPEDGIAHTQGFWQNQRYLPGQRLWFYDVSFNNPSYLPPLTPRFVYLAMVYFTQVFQ